MDSCDDRRTKSSSCYRIPSINYMGFPFSDVFLYMSILRPTASWINICEV
ncbi:hypothetical protein Plhal304r1_c051g0134381 [Plasmopara halstedii]